MIRFREGERLIQSYAIQRPPGIAVANWGAAVGVVQTTWGNVAYFPGAIPQEELDAIVFQLRRLAGNASPVTAEGDLYQILDLLSRAKSRAGISYLSMMRGYLKEGLQGAGRPSPGLVRHALGLINSHATDPTPELDQALDSDAWLVRTMACLRARPDRAER